ncbi:MAG: high light inducible protein [Acaryochloridaceae cyanobacterium SU_2_1]|nr:high light inducible protein [Acaryochloridaceae cyanobacterium SU_2_1]NJM95612.1 high light inducible protein [Acaryochloridaceae cyanobacterium CSU_5_19]
MNSQEPMWGFTNFAETLGGRLAMLGFFLGYITEWFTGEGMLAQILSIFTF